MKLDDAMNHLSNRTATSAPDILEFMRRSGPLPRQLGMSAQQVAAWGTAMISAGAAPDVAATTFRNLGQVLTKGTSATKAQREAFTPSECRS